MYFVCSSLLFFFFFFFNDTATTEIYTLSLHDALPISSPCRAAWRAAVGPWYTSIRSEEHTSELQSRGHLVCRLLLEKKKKNLNQQHLQKKNAKKIVKGMIKVQD